MSRHYGYLLNSVLFYGLYAASGVSDSLILADDRAEIKVTCICYDLQGRLLSSLPQGSARSGAPAAPLSDQTVPVDVIVQAWLAKGPSVGIAAQLAPNLFTTDTGTGTTTTKINGFEPLGRSVKSRGGVAEISVPLRVADVKVDVDAFVVLTLRRIGEDVTALSPPLAIPRDGGGIHGTHNVFHVTVPKAAPKTPCFSQCHAVRRCAVLGRRHRCRR